jgi:hypothetical protein
MAYVIDMSSSHALVVARAGRAPTLYLLGGEVGAPFSSRIRVELLGGVPYHGLQRGSWPAVG